MSCIAAMITHASAKPSDSGSSSSSGELHGPLGFDQAGASVVGTDGRPGVADDDVEEQPLVVEGLGDGHSLVGALLGTLCLCPHQLLSQHRQHAGPAGDGAGPKARRVRSAASILSASRPPARLA